MFDMYQRIGLLEENQKKVTYQTVAELSELPAALVDACQANVTNYIQLSGGYPDWESLIDDIHKYCKSKYGFDGSQLTIEII